VIAYVVRRSLWLPFLLLIVALITFVLGYYGPGDPVQVRLGPRTNPAAVARVRQELGLDRPLLVQYANYIWQALHGDFGESIVKYQGQPVRRLIGSFLPVTIQLNLVSGVLGVMIGIPLGIMAALRHGSWMDRLITALVVAGISVPTFVLAPVLTYTFARLWRILPPGGWDGIFSTKVILPAIVLALGPMAVFTRQTRTGMLDVLREDYVRTARAKGLAERAVVLRHALRNALIPLSTIMGFMLGGLVEGTFITEFWFGIPGLGRLGFDAFYARDYPIIIGLTLLIAAAYGLANLLVDLGYGFLDPRVRRA
jgi:peptide/nickel transport system permease protein